MAQVVQVRGDGLVVGHPDLVALGLAAQVAQLIHGHHRVGVGQVVGGAQIVHIGALGGKADDHVIAADLVAQDLVAVGVADAQGNLGLIGRGGDRGGTAGGAAAIQAVGAGGIIEIPDGTGLSLVVVQHALHLIAEGYAPAGEELGEVAVGHLGGDEGHALVVGIAAVCAGLPQLEELIVEGQGLGSIVMGQVELPVHTQLHEHIVGGAGTALSHLIKDGFPAFVRSEAGIQGHGASVPGLEGQGVDVVGDFGLTQFVHVVADLVGDAPAEQAVGLARAGDGSGLALDQSGSRAVLHADVVAGSVHEGTGEHAHVADVLAGGHGILIAGQGGIGVNDALDLVGDEELLLPGQHVLIHGIDHGVLIAARALQAGKHLVGGEGQEHAGGGDLGGVADIGGQAGGGQSGHIGGQLLDIGPDGILPGGLTHAVPVGQLQHRHLPGVIQHTGLKLDGLGVAAGVGQIKGAAPVGQAADLLNGNVVAAVLQGHGSALPHAGLAVELGGHHIDGGVAGQLGVDGHGGAGLGGNAQGLQVAGALAGGLIGGSGGAAALEIVLHQTQRIAVLVQQGLGQLQLIPELSGIQIVAAQRVEAGGQGGDGLLIHRALQGSEGTVGKEVGNLLRQSIAVIEGDLGDADAGSTGLLAQS